MHLRQERRTLLRVVPGLLKSFRQRKILLPKFQLKIYILFEDCSDDDVPIIIEQVFRPIELIDLTEDEPEPRKRFCYCRRVNRGDNPNLLAKKGLCTNADNTYREYYAYAKKRGVSFQNNMSIIPYINYKIRHS